MTFTHNLPPEIAARIGGRNLIVFDGTCVLCSSHFRFVLKHDRRRVFHFATAQSELGQTLYRVLDLPTVDFKTNLVILNGVIHQDMDAIAAALRGLGWPWRAGAILRFLPAPIKPPLYGLIARNRYRFFGQTDTCLIPDSDMKMRFIEGGW